MSSRSRIETIPASGVIDLGPGNFFFLLDSSAAVNVTFYGGGSNFGAENVEAGYLKRNVEHWRSAKIQGVAGTAVTYFYGDEDVREDETDYRRTVGVYREEQPSTAVDYPDVDVGSSAVAVEVAPANLSRYSVTIQNHPDSLANIRVGAPTTLAAGRGVMLQPGQSQTFRVTGAIYAIRASVAAATASINGENY